MDARLARRAGRSFPLGPEVLMDGRIKLDGIRVFAHHGLFPEERAAGQVFIIDVTLFLDMEGAASTDDLSKTIDYGALALAVHDRVVDERWDLIERVASRVADLVMEDPRIEATEVTVHKPQAPIPLEFDDVSVTIRRNR